MLNSLISALKATTSNDAFDTRRRNPRREVDRCVAVVHGHTFPIENWSLGGALIVADERLFGVGMDVDATIKFKLRNTILDVPVQGSVVRKSSGKVAVQFRPLVLDVRRAFQQVIDDYAAREFANSQAT